MELEMKRIVVVGAGAVGGAIAGLLSNAGVPVALVTRKEYLSEQQNGMTIEFPHRQVLAKPEIIGGLDQVDWRDDDLIVVATKLNDALAIFQQIQTTAGRTSSVVCANNGVQGEEWAMAHFDSVMGMMIWMPSTHLSPTDFRIYGEDCPGVLDVGTVRGSDGESKWLSQRLVGAGFDSVDRTDIMDWKYAKLMANVGNTAQALVTDDWKSVARLARSEAENVLDAAGIGRVEKNVLRQRCEKIALGPIEGQRREGGSTWQSFKRGRPLETPWIEGAIVKLAAEHNVAAPINQRLTELAENPRRVTAADLMSGLDGE